MREIDKYGVLKEKLQGICDEHNLVFTIHNQGYPFRMTIKPTGGMDAQQTMLEGMENPGDTGYISPDASLVFVYRDGELSYKISETWTISATLFNKLKNLFMKLRDMWMAYFFRDIHEHSPGAAAKTDSTADDTETPDPVTDEAGFVAEEADSVTDSADHPADYEDPFGELLGEAEPATNEETEDATPDEAGADE